MTHRQFRAWNEWLLAQWNVPDRHDWYLMAIRASIKGVLGKEPDPRSLQLPFGAPERKPQTREEATESAKSQWAGFLGGMKNGPLTEGQQALREMVRQKRPDLARKG